MRPPHAILVCESDPMFCSVLKVVLESKHFAVTTASCSADALVKLINMPPCALLLVNRLLLGSSGEELARYVRLVCPAIRILMYSTVSVRIDSTAADRVMYTSDRDLTDLVEAVRTLAFRKRGQKDPINHQKELLQPRELSVFEMRFLRMSA